MKNSNDTIGNRTRHLPTCGTVPQPTAPPRAPILICLSGIFIAMLVRALRRRPDMWSTIISVWQCFVSPIFKVDCYLHIINPLNPELNPICYLLALLGAHHFLHVSRIRVKSLTFRLLMSYIWSTHS